MSKPCKDCPFIKKNPMKGSPEWLSDVFHAHRKNPFFRHTCHKTDPNADGYEGRKKVRECYGHITMVANELDQTPGLGGTWMSYEEMVHAYLVSFLGVEKVEQIRRENEQKDTQSQASKSNQ